MTGFEQCLFQGRVFIAHRCDVLGWPGRVHVVQQQHGTAGAVIIRGGFACHGKLSAGESFLHVVQIGGSPKTARGTLNARCDDGQHHAASAFLDGRSGKPRLHRQRRGCGARYRLSQELLRRSTVRGWAVWPIIRFLEGARVFLTLCTLNRKTRRVATMTERKSGKDVDVISAKLRLPSATRSPRKSFCEWYGDASAWQVGKFSAWRRYGAWRV